MEIDIFTQAIRFLHRHSFMKVRSIGAICKKQELLTTNHRAGNTMRRSEPKRIYLVTYRNLGIYFGASPLLAGLLLKWSR